MLVPKFSHTDHDDGKNPLLKLWKMQIDYFIHKFIKLGYRLNSFWSCEKFGDFVLFPMVGMDMSTPLSQTCENLFTILARVGWYPQMNSFDMINCNCFPFDWIITNLTNPTIRRGIMDHHTIQTPFTLTMIHVFEQALKICKNLWFSIYISKVNNTNYIFCWDYLVELDSTEIV